MKDRKNLEKNVNEVSVLSIINETLSPKKKEALYNDFCKKCQITRDGMYKVLNRVNKNPDLKRLKVLADHLTGGSLDELYRKIYQNNSKTVKM